MPLPSFQKVWTVFPNNRIPFVSLNDAMASLLFGVKNALVATMGWTVWFTSNGTTGPTSGADHTDRWLTKANATTRFNGTNGAQSYAVLVNGDGAQLLLSYNGATDDIATIRYSPGGLYTLQGTTTFEPTATDEVIVSTGNSLVNATASADRVFHVWASSDKKMLRVALYRAGTLQFIWGIEQITSAVLSPSTNTPAMYGFMHSAVTLDNLAGRPHGATSGTVFTAGFLGAMARVHCSGVDQNIALVGGFMSFNQSNFNTAIFTVERTELQGGAGELMYLVQKASQTATAQGPFGTCIDWWGAFGGGATTPAVGDFFGTLQFVALGSACVWPWDGATAVFQVA